MRLCDAGAVLRSTLGCVSLVLVLGAMLCFILALRQKRYALALIPAVPGALLFVLFQCFAEMVSRDDDFRTALGQRLAKEIFPLTPVWAVVLLLAVSAAVEAVFLVRLLRWEKSHLSPNSVKAALDTLPTGFCCYRTGGRVVLANRLAEELCRTLLGRALSNGEEFAAAALSREVVQQNGRWYGFSQGSFAIDGRELFALYAADITGEYARSLELQERGRMLRQVNEKLISYNKELIDLVADNERLNAEIKMHNELGALLVAIRRHLARDSGEAERQYIRERLDENIGFLLHEGERARDEFTQISEVAAKFGVKLRVTGELPEDRAALHLIATAVHECFTNLLRHAHGDELYVSIERHGGLIGVVLTNNGDPPSDPVIPGSGLRSLGDLAEKYGGSMTIESDPAFAVRLIIPGEGTEYAL